MIALHRFESLCVVSLLQPDAILGVIRPLSPNGHCGPISDPRPSMLPDPIWPLIYIPRPTQLHIFTLTFVYSRKFFTPARASLCDDFLSSFTAQLVLT